MSLTRPVPDGPGGAPRALAVLSVHASPLGELGRGENGGMNHVIHRLCAGLAARGIPSDVFVRRDDPHSPAEEMLAPGSRLVRLNAGPSEPLPKSEILSHLPAFSRRLLEHADSEQRRYRLVHAHYWLSGWAGRRVAQRWDIPLVQSFHTLARLKQSVGLPADPERAEVEAILVRAADRMVAMSASEEAALVDLYGAAPERVCVVPPGVDLDQFSPRPTATLRRELGLLGRRVVLYAGRLERLKGADTLLEAMAAVAHRAEMADVVTLVVGEDSGDGRSQAVDSGGERGRLMAMAESLGVGDRVRFLGAAGPQRLADLYALADVCVVPSHTETFGLVALEAQASGTPVVAAAVGGLVDIVADSVSGYLVEGRDAGEFASRIIALLGDAPLRARMGDAARDRASGFTWQRSTDRLVALYDCVEDPVPAGALEACACL
ncbi:MAG TPA: glycosyltransferase [Candidatus Dormibacteraeota bacterium]|jgi:D-inositol-3-phosphate glycosyltransferase|nr:glycosyltransferase [Candidatus Dormibacteraeota bacterium]